MEELADGSNNVSDTVVLVTKIPQKGISKTRIEPMLGDKAWLLSRAMLEDTLYNMLVILACYFYRLR